MMRKAILEKITLPLRIAVQKMISIPVKHAVEISFLIIVLTLVGAIVPGWRSIIMKVLGALTIFFFFATIESLLLKHSGFTGDHPGLSKGIGVCNPFFSEESQPASVSANSISTEFGTLTFLTAVCELFLLAIAVFVPMVVDLRGVPENVEEILEGVKEILEGVKETREGVNELLRRAPPPP